MKLFDLLKIQHPELSPEETKIHLATWNGEDNPLDVFLGGEFDEWQKWQTKKNFERKYIVSLISLPQTNKWLLAGIYLSQGVELNKVKGCHYYNLVEDDKCTEWNGRLVVHFERTARLRQSYLYAENLVDKMELSEIYAKRLTISEFPGYRGVDISRNEFELIFSQSLESWRTALSNVAGVYLISDPKTGGLYVGAAYGEGGFWQRWSDYFVTGHGGNVEIKALLEEQGQDHLKGFRYSILEIADIHASKEDVLDREAHWKNVLLTRSHGLNAN